MNSLSVVVLCAALAAANAGLLGGALVGPAAEGIVLQGPGSSATVQGPDGSVISSSQPGGAVVAAPHSGGIVAGAAPLVAAPLVHPGLVHPGHLVGGGVVAARLGSVAHHGLVSAPLIAGHAGYPLLAAGSGLEGQYLHDYTETLYDNGQYHGEIYA